MALTVLATYLRTLPLLASLVGTTAVPLNSSYQSVEGCPSLADFVQEVVARSTAGDRERAQSTALHSSVAFHIEHDAAEGRLIFPWGEQRQIQGTTCREVVQALALVVALQAKRAEPTTKETDKVDVESTEKASAVVPLVPGAPSLGPVELPQPVTRLPERRFAASMELSGSLAVHSNLERLRPARWTLGGGAMVALGPAPEPLYGGALFVERAELARLPTSADRRTKPSRPF
jgi:hypothetical protein